MRIAHVIAFGFLALAAAPAQAGSASGTFNVGVSILPPGQPAPLVRNANFTPVASATVLAGMGFTNVRLLRRDSAGYVFLASRGPGQVSYLVTMSAWQGKVLAVRRA